MTISGIPVLTKSKPAGADFDGHLFLAFTGTEDEVAAAAAATAAIVGVSERLGGKAGAMADIIMLGEYPIRAGGDITAGDPLTADVQGRAILAVPAVASIVRVGAFALADGVLGDLVPALIVPSIINTP